MWPFGCSLTTMYLSPPNLQQHQLKEKATTTYMSPPNLQQCRLKDKVTFKNLDPGNENPCPFLFPFPFKIESEIHKGTHRTICLIKLSVHDLEMLVYLISAQVRNLRVNETLLS